MPNPTKTLNDLHTIIKTLRAPAGCPWDQKQTPDSFKSYIIEEAHELLEAIDEGDPQQIKEELGDMYFQLTFLGQLYEESGEFCISDAIEAIIKKMIHRHPHVFANETISSEAEQRRRWNELKSSEKTIKKSATTLISDVPKSMPALRRAQRVSERAAHNGFEWEGFTDLFKKLTEETKELQEAIKKEDKAGIQEELGDMLFVLVNLSRLSSTNAEEALLATTEKFIARFALVDKSLQDSGRSMQETSSSDLLDLWQKAKNDLT